MDELNCNTVMLRDNRYDGILHLVTSAEGTTDAYAAINSEGQYETTESAIEIDKKLRHAYMGHSKWLIINNDTSDF